MTDIITLIPNANLGTSTLPNGSPMVLDVLLAQDCRLHFPSLPTVQFFLQGVKLPTISVNNVTQSTRYVDANQIGEKLNFESFNVTFLVDKNFANWASIFNWMKRMTVSGSNVDEVDNPTIIIGGIETIQFIGAWPTSLAGIDFDTTLPDATYVKATLTLNYDYINYIGPSKTIDSTYDKSNTIKGDTSITHQ